MAKKNNRPKTPPKRKLIFNLLKPYNAPPTSWDKAYDWLLGKARVVMIVAEVVVALSFVTKVVVDVQAKDLDEQLDTAYLELSAFAASLEPSLRQIQQKSSAYQNVWEGSYAYSEIINEILDGIPDLSSEIDIRISEGKLSIRGDDQIDTLSEIEANIKTSPTFSAVSISNLTSEGGELELEEGRFVLNAIINPKLRAALGTEGSSTETSDVVTIPE